MYRIVYSDLCRIILTVVFFLAYGNIAFGDEASYSNKLPKPTSLQMAALGAKVIGIEPPLTVNDILYLEPVCALIFKLYNLHDKDLRIQQWYIQLEGSPLLDLPENNIAKGVSSFHHYCWSKVAEFRYYRETDSMKKAGLSKYASGNYKFIIDHPEYRPANWPYLPKLYVNYGYALMLGGDLTQSALAIDAFETAIRINGAFVSAMIALADVYEKLGNKSKALEYITEGLRHNPNSKGLKSRYDELGGKSPYPEPYPTPQSTSHNDELKPTEESPFERKEDPVTMTPNEIITQSVKEAGQGADSKNIAPAANSAGKNQDQPETGTGSQSGNNPYCRFCP